MSRTGRPRIIQISPEVFEGMCRVQCTEQEIANILGCGISTLKRWIRRTYRQTFEQVYKNNAEFGKMSLRRAQMKVAIDQGNPTMLIWLGKQYLGQRDKQDVAVDVTITRELAEETVEVYIQTVKEVEKQDIDHEQAMVRMQRTNPTVYAKIAPVLESSLTH